MELTSDTHREPFVLRFFRGELKKGIIHEPHLLFGVDVDLGDGNRRAIHQQACSSAIDSSAVTLDLKHWFLIRVHLHRQRSGHR